jgi:hypothetical protein
MIYTDWSFLPVDPYVQIHLPENLREQPSRLGPKVFVATPRAARSVPLFPLAVSLSANDGLCCIHANGDRNPCQDG